MNSQNSSSSFIHVTVVKGMCNAWMIFFGNYLMFLSYPFLCA